MVIDLGSLLLKPVQRVLKYPLLLRELLKTTPQPMPGEDASYYQEIVEANKIAENISKEINQAKRAFDLGQYLCCKRLIRAWYFSSSYLVVLD